MGKRIVIVLERGHLVYIFFQWCVRSVTVGLLHVLAEALLNSLAIVIISLVETDWNARPKTDCFSYEDPSSKGFAVCRLESHKYICYTSRNDEHWNTQSKINSLTFSRSNVSFVYLIVTFTITLNQTNRHRMHAENSQFSKAKRGLNGK